jgi:hypothetical protein
MTPALYAMLGQTIIIMGYRKDDEVRVGRLVDIRDTEVDTLCHATRKRNQLTRGRYLIYVWDENRKVQRSYYLSHCGDITVLGWLDYAWHSLLCLLGYRKPLA